MDSLYVIFNAIFCPKLTLKLHKAWDLLGLERPFTARDVDGGVYDATHFAQLIAALGPPPPEFLAKNPERRADFWDENGRLFYS